MLTTKRKDELVEWARWLPTQEDAEKVEELLKEIDRLQSVHDAQARIIADSEGIELERDGYRLEVERLESENTSLKTHIERLHEIHAERVTRLEEECDSLRARHDKQLQIQSDTIHRLESDNAAYRQIIEDVNGDAAWRDLRVQLDSSHKREVGLMASRIELKSQNAVLREEVRVLKLRLEVRACGKSGEL